MNSFELKTFANDSELAATAANTWLQQIEAANAATQWHRVALSGGRITQKFFAAVVEQAKARNVPFDRVHFFWADERCVPPDDPESNFRLTQELLFVPLSISENRIHRVRGEEPPESAARDAEADLRQIAPVNPDGQPVLDLIFLGLGEDGHVASLFPDEPEEIAASKAVYRAITKSPKPPAKRVTLGYSTIAAAQNVWVLSSGTGKERALRESLTGGPTSLARVLRLRKGTEIYTDIRV